MKYFALAVLLAVMQTSPPVPREAADQSNGARQNVKKQPGSDKIPAQQSPPIVQPISPAPNQDTSHSPAPENTQKPVLIRELPPVSVTKDGWDRIYICFTGVLIVVGIIGVRAAYKTLGEMKAQRVAMQGQLAAMQGQLGQMESAGKQTDKIIEHASKQVIAAEGQVELMKTAGTHTEQLAQQAVRQTKLNQTQLEISQRPWVSVTRLPQALQFNATGAVLGCTYKLENCGGSVAWNISIWADLVPEGTDWRPTLDRLQSVMTSPQNENSDYGYVLFPKESLKQYQPSICRRQDLDDLIQKDIFKGTGKVGFKLVGCIDYRSHVSPRHYQTVFVDLVGYPDQIRGAVMGAFDPTVAAYMPIILTPHGHGASAT